MPFLGVNPLAVGVAAFAAFAFGGIWYGVLSAQWMAAARLPEGQPRSQAIPLVVTFLAELVIALFIAGLMAHFAHEFMTIRAGLLTGLAIWTGFVMPTIVVNHQFQMAPFTLTIIDGLHWLGVFLIQGAVVGWFGVI